MGRGCYSECRPRGISSRAGEVHVSPKSAFPSPWKKILEHCTIDPVRKRFGPKFFFFLLLLKIVDFLSSSLNFLFDIPTIAVGLI